MESQTEYTRLTELLLRLQDDSNLLVAFNKDPDTVIREAGITSEEYKNALKSRDMLKIREVLVGKQPR